MGSILRLSRYTFMFKRDDKFLIYNSRNNNFYETDEDSYSALIAFNDGQRDSLDNDTIKQLHAAKIITSEIEDNDFVATLQFRHNARAFNLSHLGLTIAPTVCCNLACPYCFEVSKPKDYMSIDTCDAIVNFIQSHKLTKQISICWYGGEPLLAIDRIEYLLSKFYKLENIEFTRHSILTNATLLTGKVLDVFQQYPLDDIQITFDGLKETHDKKRRNHAGQGSFDTIISNIKTFSKLSPKTIISIRINIDRSNWHEYKPLKQYIESQLDLNPNIRIYPGILRGGYGCDINDNFFSNEDLLAFYNFLNKEEISHNIYPSHVSKGCSATNACAYIIGPKGELYNCWEEMGNSRYSIGNIRNKSLYKEFLFNRYMIYGTPFSDPKCINCGLLPVCSGGCPRKRLQNIIEHRDNELCYIYSQNNNNALFDFLMNYYKNHLLSQS